MTNHELLREKYEDALLALLMEEVAIAEGEKAIEENERLKNDPNAALSKATMRRCRNTIARAFAKRNLKTSGRAAKKAFRVAAVAALISLLLVSVAFATMPSVRRSILNFGLELHDKSLTLFLTDDSNSADTDAAISLDWMPDGFELVGSEEDSFKTMLHYEDGTGNYFRVLYYSSQDMMISMDSEDGEIQKLEILGMSAFLIEKENEMHIVFSNQGNIMVEIISEGITEDELIKIAENLRF